MTKFDVLTVGNAIVDIIARCDEAFIADNGIIKGAMNLIDAERAELLYTLGLAAVKRGDVTVGRNLLEEAVETHPQHFEAAARSLAALQG